MQCWYELNDDMLTKLQANTQGLKTDYQGRLIEKETFFCFNEKLYSIFVGNTIPQNEWREAKFKTQWLY